MVPWSESSIKIAPNQLRSLEFQVLGFQSRNSILRIPPPLVVLRLRGIHHRHPCRRSNHEPLSVTPKRLWTLPSALAVPTPSILHHCWTSPVISRVHQSTSRCAITSPTYCAHSPSPSCPGSPLLVKTEVIIGELTSSVDMALTSTSSSASVPWCRPCVIRVSVHEACPDLNLNPGSVNPVHHEASR